MDAQTFDRTSLILRHVPSSVSRPPLCSPNTKLLDEVKKTCTFVIVAHKNCSSKLVEVQQLANKIPALQNARSTKTLLDNKGICEAATVCKVFIINGE